MELRLQFEEIDLLRDRIGGDLSSEEMQASHILKVAMVDWAIVTPPCHTHSRAPWSNNFGPCPVRSKAYPRGFPWLDKVLAAKAELANNLVDFTWKMMSAVQAQRSSRWCSGLAEHPEDFGIVHSWDPCSIPASIWQMQEPHDLVEIHGWQTRAFHQAPFGAKTAKGTRILFCEGCFSELGVEGWPTFSAQGRYSGPLEHMANPGGYSMMRKAGDSGAFKTSESAAYPSLLCKFFAFKAVKAFKEHVPTLRGGGYLWKCSLPSD